MNNRVEIFIKEWLNENKFVQNPIEKMQYIQNYNHNRFTDDKHYSIIFWPDEIELMKYIRLTDNSYKKPPIKIIGYAIKNTKLTIHKASYILSIFNTTMLYDM